ncbi:unnamed protein product [Brassica rapa]|uniref:Uncharacterized protein n=2 Tax=Brassica TaxID=3705 RepID=A0A3P5Z5Y2_BRACM|nr:unnamed protein product [Brassica napus]CAG7872502.1 unnamed protein product [Brassica rapa]VDC68351.1 unnamed protein product [Brassica rapa]
MILSVPSAQRTSRTPIVETPRANVKYTRRRATPPGQHKASKAGRRADPGRKYHQTKPRAVNQWRSSEI